MQFKSHSSALSRPALKARAIWMVCLVLTLSGDFLLFLPKERLLPFFQKTSNSTASYLQRLLYPCVLDGFRWNLCTFAAVCRRDIEVSKGKLLYQSLLPTSETKFIPSTHQRGQEMLVKITAQEQPKYLDCCEFTWESLLCQGLESPTRTPAVQLVHPADSTSNLLSFRNYLPV